jgi:hypothetical protein
LNLRIRRSFRWPVRRMVTYRPPLFVYKKVAERIGREGQTLWPGFLNESRQGDGTVRHPPVPICISHELSAPACQPTDAISAAIETVRGRMRDSMRRINATNEWDWGSDSSRRAACSSLGSKSADTFSGPESPSVGQRVDLLRIYGYGGYRLVPIKHKFAFRG